MPLNKRTSKAKFSSSRHKSDQGAPSRKNRLEQTDPHTSKGGSAVTTQKISGLTARLQRWRAATSCHRVCFSCDSSARAVRQLIPGTTAGSSPALNTTVMNISSEGPDVKGRVQNRTHWPDAHPNWKSPQVFTARISEVLGN